LREKYTVTEPFWLGPTYEFRSGDWILTAGVHGETGRLEWLLSQVEGGIETSHSFVLEPHAGPAELELLLGALPAEQRDDLVAQVTAQSDPQLLSSESDSKGLA
jgi:hypothetical protein